jgi:predicted DNA-binding transcriptional regulator YafY
MRHEKANNLLQLALEMQAARGGLSLDDIEEKFDVGRRTAMRMRDAVLEVFPHADEVETDERKKRWRLPKGTLDRLVGVTADELGDIEVAINLLKRDNLLDQAASLEGILTKLRAVMSPAIANRIETDLDALLEAEGLAMRPGPKPRSRAMVLEDLRDAVKACRKVEIQYRNRATRRINKRVVHPYGFLYGHRHYLVAYNLVKGAQGYRLFSLPNIERVVLLDEYFERDDEFSLEAFSRQSFGVFQETPFEVVWRFSPRAAADAQDFLFHPEQEVELQQDGSLIVRFTAGGALEMCWHLYAWGDDVEVLEPQSLRDLVSKNRPSWPGLP